MYTSRGKANDRFGSDVSGIFRIPYRHDRLAAAAGMAVIVTVALFIVIHLVMFFDITVNTQKNIVNYWVVDLWGYGTENTGSTKSMYRAAESVESVIIECVLLAALCVGFAVLSGKLHNGRICRFSSTDESFTVIYPGKNGEKVVVPYSDVFGISWKERRFPFTPVCCRVTVTCRDKNFRFLAIMSKAAQANGITDTPFNIIREKTGLADKDEQYLINRGKR